MDGPHPNAKKVLNALNDMGGSANTSEIRTYVDLTSQAVGWHASQLQEQGLIEQDGTEDVGAPIDANVYRITEEGEGVSDEIETGMSREEMQSKLRDHADHVEEIDSLVSRVDAMESKVKQLERRSEFWKQTAIVLAENEEYFDLETIQERVDRNLG